MECVLAGTMSSSSPGRNTQLSQPEPAAGPALRPKSAEMVAPGPDPEGVTGPVACHEGKMKQPKITRGILEAKIKKLEEGEDF